MHKMDFSFPTLKKKKKLPVVFFHTQSARRQFSGPFQDCPYITGIWCDSDASVCTSWTLSEKGVFGLQRTFVIDKQGMDADCPVEEFFLRGSVWGPASIWFNSEDIDYARSLCVQHSANAAENELKKTRGARSLPVRKEGEGAQPFLSQAVGKAPQPDKVASIVTI